MQVLLCMIDWNAFDPPDLLERDDPSGFRDLYLCEWEPPEHMWVIPHGHALDYCSVVVLTDMPDGRGRVRVEGRRTEGWTRDGAFIRSKVAADKLTSVPSWHRDFLELYDDPHDPRLKERSAHEE